MITLLTSGPRDFSDEKFIHDAIRNSYWIEKFLAGENRVINGGATGVDAFVKSYFEKCGVPVQQFKPEYDKHHGKAAPLIRNKEMAAMCSCGLIFWSGCGRFYRGGTLHTMNELAMAGKNFYVVALPRY